MLEKGRIDAFVGAREIIETKLNIENKYLTLGIRESWLQCSKKSPRVNMKTLNILSQKLSQLRTKNQGVSLIDSIHLEQFAQYFAKSGTTK
jgi:hypothetical protein